MKFFFHKWIVDICSWNDLDCHNYNMRERNLETSRFRILDFVEKFFFSKRIFSIDRVFCCLWNAKTQQTRQMQQQEHFSIMCCFKYNVVLNRSRSFYDCRCFFFKWINTNSIVLMFQIVFSISYWLIMFIWRLINSRHIYE